MTKPIKDAVASEWSGIDVTAFGPYKESLQARFGEALFAAPERRRALAYDPKLWSHEIGIEVRGTLTVIDKSPDEFVFVVPAMPTEEELWYRYEQISDWWMLAHAFYWWMRREHGADAAEPFLSALHVQIIGRTWTDPDWRARLLDDPRATLEAETGGRFAPDLAVRAVEEADGHVLVLPTPPEAERVADGARYTASLFAAAHTWWQWLVWPRLMTPPGPTRIAEMVS